VSRTNAQEETWEVLDAIERRDWTNLREELGDLTLQVLFYAQMASESEEAGFSIADVLEALNRKLVRRHPHVFGQEASRAAGNRVEVDAAVDGSAERVLANWDAIKQAEKQAAKPSEGKDVHNSLLDGVVRGQPALAEAVQIGSKSAKVGFDWPVWTDLLKKLAEETEELVAEAHAPEEAPNRKKRMEAELGDLLFTAAQLARHLDVDAEMALRGANLRFRRRFARMELAADRGLAELEPEALEELWRRAKLELAAEESGDGKR
jgi:MazG family protein